VSDLPEPRPDQPPSAPATPPTEPAASAAPPDAAMSPGGVPPAPGPDSPAAQQPVVSWEPSRPSTATPVPGAPGLAFATTAERVVAFVIDALIVGVIAVVISVVLGVAPTTVRTTGTTTSWYTTANAIVAVVVNLAYFVGSWTGGRRATVGQRLLHLQVGNAFDGKPLSVEQALSRWAGLGLFLGVGGLVPALAGLASLVQLVWAIALVVSTATSPTKQGLHDRFANTAVVRPIDQRSGTWVMACLVLIILGVVLVLIALLGLIFLGSQVQDILSQQGRSI
jgi:uncharacterized RDD family membrane protein YckC